MNGVVLDEDKVIYLEDHDCAILSDLHLGAVSRTDPYPVMEHEEIHTRILRFINDYNPQKMIFNGDIFNTGTIDEYWIDMFEEFNSNVDELVFHPGNHELKRDGFPDFIRQKYEIQNNSKIGDFFVHHGHRTPPVKSKFHIIGHLHPCADEEDVLIQKKNAYYNSDVLVIPKFSNAVGCSSIYNGSPKGHCPIIDDGIELQKYNIVKRYSSDA